MELFKFFKAPTPRISQLEFAGQTIEVIRKPYQKTLRLSVHATGRIRLSCRVNTTAQAIHEFLSLNENWLKNCLDNYGRAREKFPPKKFVSGERFPLLGRDLFWHSLHSEISGKPKLFLQMPNLIAVSAKTVAAEDWLREVQKLYRDKAKKFLPERLQFWSEKTVIPFKTVSIRGQKTRWGSCSTSGRISLNWKLMVFPVEIVDYVLIHELAHVREQNHSPRFWAVVEKYCPQFRTHKKWLRENRNLADFLG